MNEWNASHVAAAPPPLRVRPPRPTREPPRAPVRRASAGTLELSSADSGQRLVTTPRYAAWWWPPGGICRPFAECMWRAPGDAGKGNSANRKQVAPVTKPCSCSCTDPRGHRTTVVEGADVYSSRRAAHRVVGLLRAFRGRHAAPSTIGRGASLRHRVSGKVSGAALCQGGELRSTGAPPRLSTNLLVGYHVTTSRGGSWMRPRIVVL